MTFGDAMLYLLAQNDMRQIDLANKVGVSRQTINNFVNGVAKWPSLALAKKIADALNVSLDDLADLCFSDGGDVDND